MNIQSLKWVFWFRTIRCQNCGTSGHFYGSFCPRFDQLKRVKSWISRKFEQVTFLVVSSIGSRPADIFSLAKTYSGTINHYVHIYYDAYAQEGVRLCVHATALTANFHESVRLHGRALICQSRVLMWTFHPKQTVISCWKNNQSANVTLDCCTGKMCLFYVFHRAFSNDGDCGTYLGIHKEKWHSVQGIDPFFSTVKSTASMINWIQTIIILCYS